MSAERILRPAWPKPAERPKPREYLAGAFVTTIWDEPSTDDADDNISSDHVLAGWHQLSKAADRKALKCCECGEPLDLHGVAGYASVASSGDPRVREYSALCLGCGKNRHAVLAKLHGFLARMFDPDF